MAKTITTAAQSTAAWRSNPGTETMVNSASPWQHTAIPLDTAISRRADASLNAPFVRLWQAFLSGRIFQGLALILL